MKKAAMALVLAAGVLIGGGVIYRVASGPAGPPSPEVSSRLMLAKKFNESNEPGKALQVLDELANQGVKLGEEADLIRIQAFATSGDHAQTAAAAEAFLKQYPESASKNDALSAELTAKVYLGTIDDATRVRADQFLTDNPAHPASAPLMAALAKNDLKSGNAEAAHQRLSSVLKGEGPTSDAAFEAASALGEKNLARLLSPEPQDGDVVYTLQRGDSINRIARKHGVTEELLLRANNIKNPKSLSIGQKIRVPSVDFSLHVDIAKNTMVLKNKGEFFKLYRVRTGREKGATPTGTFKVLNKKKEPTWRPGNGYVYGPDDPNNELGTRWMAFEGDILGIHGTLHPDTIGHYASNGCVGMLTEEVEELFDLITTGTSITIEGEQDLTAHKVIPPPQVPPPVEVASN